jgi:ADP-ribosylglycohydrolase
MALTLAESLAECRRFDVDDLGDRYLAWYRSGRAFDTGAVAWQVLQRVDEGQSWRDAAARVHDESDGMTAGCNAAHRVAPLSLAGFIADDALPVVAAESARLTHWHPLAGDAASAVAVLCRSLLRGRPWDAALADAAAGWDPGRVLGTGSHVIRRAGHRRLRARRAEGRRPLRR